MQVLVNIGFIDIWKWRILNWTLVQYSRRFSHVRAPVKWLRRQINISLLVECLVLEVLLFP